jgi:cyclic-di-GMP phosphodiesterase TipF (flagellum assembly factor)
MLDFLTANRAIARSLVLQFSQSVLTAMGSAEHHALAALTESGFRFCIDEATAVGVDPAELTNRGVRYVKMHANLLLRAPRAPGTETSLGELSERLSRSGIDLIADRIEDERSVIDLLDCDVRFGQGSLFSPPRPLRPEAMQASPGPAHASTGQRIAPATPPHDRATEADARDRAPVDVIESGTFPELAGDLASR